MVAEGRNVGKRRLGAIMFTDLVGYSSITSLDERKALRLLDEHRGLLEAAFRRYGGRVVKTMGDGFLVEFVSAVEAVDCAVEAQKEMRTFNEGRGRDDKIFARIGIHVGDVVHSGADILGDAVNVASRVQPLAEPGGVCVTRQVVDQIERKMDYKLLKMGTRELKNIRYPVEVYKVEVPSGVSKNQQRAFDSRRIAILPLVNLSADPSDRYFVDGMTEELISTVSKINELSVISRTSMMRYKDANVPIGEIGRELSAGTVLEGSVRKAGNKVRITTQLIDSQNDKHLWAQSYDRDLTDIFAIQGDIAERVAESLKVKLLSKKRKALEKRATVNADAYTLYLKGRYFWNERSQEGLKKAIGYFGEAIRLDPNFALAYSGLADCYLIQVARAFSPYAEAGPRARSYAEKAVELDGDLAEAHASLALSLQTGWDLAGAERELKRAIELKPNYATAHHWYWNTLTSLGRLEEGFEHEKRAFQLDPYSSVVSQGIGIGLMYLGRFREAIAQFERLAETEPAFYSAHFWNAWAHEGVGELDEAIAEARKAVESAEGRSIYPMVGLAQIYVRAGQREQAVKLLDEIQSDSSGRYVSPTLVAMVKLELGEKDEAIRLLERAYLEHDSALGYFREFPWLAKYRSDPRWLEIERKMGY